MTEPYRFDQSDIESQTTAKVRKALDEDRGLLVYGACGSGKSHAVRAAVNGAVWARVPFRPFAVPRLISDIAAQVGAGEGPLRAFLDKGCPAACEELDRRISDRVLVVDAADWLWSPADDPVFPDATAIWADESASLSTWLMGRVATKRTVVISRRCPEVQDKFRTKHQVPDQWPTKLVRSDPGYLNWVQVSDRVAKNPAGLSLAASVLRFAGVHRMRLWLEDDEVDPSARGLGRLFRRHAPRSLIRILSLLLEAGELSRGLVDTVVANGDDARPSDDLSVGLDLAISLGLVTQREGILRAMPFLMKADAVPAIERAGAESLAEKVSQQLLRGVNDRSSLKPGDARAVLDAHRLQLALGDFDGALTTSRLHLGGLIAHARGLSKRADRPEAYDQARRAYASILQLMATGSRAAQVQTHSYVIHYHGFNGHRAQTLGLDRVATDYRHAVRDWPENALFHARLIALEVERGDLERARSCLKFAYDRVAEHPRREAVLRVHPAGWVFHAGVPIFALELLENTPLLDSLADIDPEAHQVLARLHATWRGRGIEVENLETEDRRHIVFQVPVRFRLKEEASHWTASMEYPPAQATGPGPRSATRNLAKQDRRRMRAAGEPTDRSSCSTRGGDQGPLYRCDRPVCE